MKLSDSTKQKLRCKELYFSYFTREQIIKETGCALGTLNTWIYQRDAGDADSWHVEREKKRLKLSRSYAGSIPPRLIGSYPEALECSKRP